MSRLITLVAAATAASYALLIWVGFTQLQPEAGGQLAFDVRIWGYGVAEGESYLAALSETGRAILLGPVRLLDTVFPPLLGLLLALLIHRNGRGWLAVLPFGYTAVDLWENAVVAQMVRDDAPSLADSASNLTQAKYALLALSLAVLWMAWRDRG